MENTANVMENVIEEDTSMEETPVVTTDDSLTPAEIAGGLVALVAGIAGGAVLVKKVLVPTAMSTYNKIRDYANERKAFKKAWKEDRELRKEVPAETLQTESNESEETINEE